MLTGHDPGMHKLITYLTGIENNKANVKYEETLPPSTKTHKEERITPMGTVAVVEVYFVFLLSYYFLQYFMISYHLLPVGKTSGKHKKKEN